MFFYHFSYLKFWLTATNQHGVHSPFIYRFVTQCLYNKSRFKTDRSTNILLKTIAYYKLTKIQVLTSDDHIEQQLSTHINGASITDTSKELIYLDPLNKQTLQEYLIHNQEISNDTMVYIPCIYKNRDRHTFWKKIKELEKVTVSIDMFYGGLLFFRKEQAKEHFKIRI